MWWWVSVDCHQGEVPPYTVVRRSWNKHMINLNMENITFGPVWACPNLALTPRAQPLFCIVTYADFVAYKGWNSLLPPTSKFVLSSIYLLQNNQSLRIQNIESDWLNQILTYSCWKTRSPRVSPSTHSKSYLKHIKLNALLYCKVLNQEMED